MSDADLLVNFRKAARKLSAQMDPVTPQTLRASAREPDSTKRFGWWPPSDAFWIFIFLGGIAFFSLLFIGYVETQRDFLLTWHPIDPGYNELPTDEQEALIATYDRLARMEYAAPFFYGLLGACTRLLLTTRAYAAARAFDPARVPQYFTRLILGLIAGGIILLFVERIIDDGSEINISSAALGFLAGYNVDFLLQAIDRIMQAILPRVGLETVQRQRPRIYDYVRPDAPTPPQPASTESLAKLADDADDPDVRKALLDILKAQQNSGKG